MSRRYVIRRALASLGVGVVSLAAGVSLGQTLHHYNAPLWAVGLAGGSVIAVFILVGLALAGRPR